MQNTEHEENFNAYTQTVFFPCKVLYSYIKQLHIPLDSCRPILHCVKKKKSEDSSTFSSIHSSIL